MRKIEQCSPNLIKKTASTRVASLIMEDNNKSGWELIGVIRSLIKCIEEDELSKIIDGIIITDENINAININIEKLSEYLYKEIDSTILPKLKEKTDYYQLKNIKL